MEKHSIKTSNINRSNLESKFENLNMPPSNILNIVSVLIIICGFINCVDVKNNNMYVQKNCSDYFCACFAATVFFKLNIKYSKPSKLDLIINTYTDIFIYTVSSLFMLISSGMSDINYLYSTQIGLSLVPILLLKFIKNNEHSFFVYSLIYFVVHFTNPVPLLQKNINFGVAQKFAMIQFGILNSNNFLLLQIMILKEYVIKQFNDIMLFSLMYAHVGLIFDIYLKRLSKHNYTHLAEICLLIAIIHPIIGVVFQSVYMCCLFWELAQYLKCHIFIKNVNVYCCGVFDLCHVGHKKMFNASIKYGSCLIVGVHNDDVVTAYKRTPAMTHDERCLAVIHCQHVDKVIPNANLLITLDELVNNNIDIVVCSTEYYSDENDKYYDIPRKLGILRPIPYSTEISTSDLINRIRTNTNI